MATKKIIKDTQELSIYDSGKKKVRLLFNKNNPKSVSKTEQHHREETNINRIVNKYGVSGLLTEASPTVQRYPQFGDFTNVVDFHSAQNKLVEIKTYFASLPAKLREKFNNDPRQLMAFMSNEENIKEAQELGLLEKPVVGNDGSIVEDKPAEAAPEIPSPAPEVTGGTEPTT